MRVLAAITLTVLSVFGFRLRADPYIGYCSPAGIQAGTTNRIVIGGQRLWSLKKGVFSGEGLSVIAIEHVPNFPNANGHGQRAWLDKWIYSIFSGDRRMPPIKVKDEQLVGWTRCPWWEKLDELSDLELSMVTRGLFVQRNALQMSPALSERAILTVVAAPDAKPGVRYLTMLDPRGASAPRPFLVSSEPHVFEPFYLPPPNKKGIPRPPNPPLVAPPVVLDGQVMPGETDVFQLSLSKGDRLVCRLSGRSLTPFLGDAVPGFFNPVLRLTDADGRELAFADDYGYLPDPVLTCEIPDDGVYRLEVRDNLFRGREDFVYSVSCLTDERDLPKIAERAFETYPESRQPVPPSTNCVCIEEGTLSSPNSSGEHDFEVDSPGTWDFELIARRHGSPLDGVLKLYGPLEGIFRKTGPLLATWDDVTNAVYVGTVPQAECDPIGRWTFDRPGTYRLVVEDRIGCGGGGYDYVLKRSPAQRSFCAYANKSSFVLPPGKKETLRFKVRLIRSGGFSGAVRLESDGTFAFEPAEIPAGTDEASVIARPLRRDWQGMKSFRFSASAEVSPGHRMTVPLVAADETEQAFATTHFLPVGDFRVWLPNQQLQPVETPQWIGMPSVRIYPHRVIRPHADMAPFKTSFVQAMNELSEVDVPIAEVPSDADDGVLAVKFVSSAARVRRRPVATLAYEPAGPDASSAACAVLAGVRRLVDRNLGYADGDERRVRTLARAASLSHGNDLLVYVPSTDDNPLNGPAGEAARRLRRDGWCFDFVTDRTAERAPYGQTYQAVFVPGGESSLTGATRSIFEEMTRKRHFRIVYDDGKSARKQLRAVCRREDLPPGVRFARYGYDWDGGWYFVHNPTETDIVDKWKFNIRGRARTAFAMNVETGKIECLPRCGAGKETSFAFCLPKHGSAWIFVTVRERK